jgi:hypothetical protein
MDGVSSLNEYLKYINKIQIEKSSSQMKREYWIELFNLAPSQREMKENLPIAMALIHPEFPDCGKPSRTGFIRSLSDNCQLGKIVMGAECLNPAEEKDHIWPLSLGGSTIDSNRADLCTNCNRGKGSTVVGYFPWTGKTPEWVIQKIFKIRSNIGI